MNHFNIFSLIKIFDNKSHLNDFIDGNLYMNRISYFKKYDDQNDKNRFDRNEGIAGWHQPEKTTITIGGIQIPSSDIVSPIKSEYKIINNIPIFCLYSINNRDFGDITENNFNDFNKYMILDERVHSLGNYCVIITRTKPFLDRVIESAKRHKLKILSGLVKYYDPDIFHGQFKLYESIFMKQNNYLHQNEFRIAIISEIKGEDPFIFKIGNIKDICHVCETKDINRLIRIGWSNP